jgi:hypothetical protein
MVSRLRFTHSLLALGLAAVLGSAAPAQAPQILPPSAPPLQPSAGIIGRIVDQQSQHPVGGARIALLGTPRRGDSDSTGRFTQAGLAAGSYLLQVRAIGYGVTSWLIELEDGEVLDQVFELAPLAYSLSPVVVEGRPGGVGIGAQRMQSFGERRREGRGVFITQEQIEASNPANVVDLLRDIPGLRLLCRAGQCTVRMTRGARGAGCQPDWVVDGLHATYSTFPNMPAVGIVAIEVYRTVSETPMQFLRTDNVCGTIVIWTKSGS